MKALLKKLWRDRRGNALVIAGAALPLVVGAAGLASDTVHWALWKRQMQRAADSAALAGVYARAQNTGMTLSNVQTIVNHDLVENNHLAVNLKTGYPAVSLPADSGTWTYKVKVDLAVQKTLGFSSLFMSAAPTITVSATAAMIPDGAYCVVALKKTGPALILQGSSQVAMGCGAISNSVSSTSVNTNGTSYNFVADPIASAGGMPTTVNGAVDLQPYHTPLPDPYAGKYSTNVPSNATCTNFSQKTYNVGSGQGAVQHLRPGCYTQFNPNQGANNGTYYLDPGVYYMNNVGVNIQGNTKLIGTGVTIVLTGTTPGTVTMAGSSSMQLVAPTATTCGVDYAGTNSCNYKNMLFIQSPNATADNSNLITGDNNSTFDGAFYFPKGQVEMTGSSATGTKCAMIVGYTVKFSGNTNVQNDTVGCTANTTVSAKAIRLIA